MAASSPRRLALAAVLVLAAAPLATAQPSAAPPPAAAPATVDGGSIARDGGSGHVDGGEDPSAEAAPLNTPDDSANADEIEEQSEDLAAMKQAEAQGVDPGAGFATRLFAGSHRLGGGSALSLSLRDALDDDLAYQPLLPDLAGDADPNVGLAFDIVKAKGEYDIPVEMRAEVAQWVRFFQGSGRKYFRHWLARSTRYIPVMRDILHQEGVPEDTVYLSMIESGFSTLAYSWARASGPWQFIDATGKRFGLKVDFWVDERRDPIKSTRAAARYLRELHEQFGDWYLAWAGYNAGGGKIKKGIAKYNTHDFWQMCGSGRFLRNETKNYVPKLIAAALVTKHPAQFGFTRDEVEFEQPLESEDVKVVNPTDLQVIARASDCSLEEIQTLNPELRRWLTPPASEEKPFIVHVPKGKRVAFETNYPRLAPKERLTFHIVRVKRGDTLSKIALANHSFPEAILKMNGLKSTRKLKVNSELMVPVAGEAAVARAEEEVKTGKRKKLYDDKDEVPAGTASGPMQASGSIQHQTVDGKDRVLYGVASGDNLWVIGQKFGVGVDELKAWNDLKGKRPKLSIGQSLVVFPRALPPASAAAAPAVQLASAPAVAPVIKPAVATARVAPDAADQVTQAGKTKHIKHTLVTGDSLWSLSQKYGVTVEELKRLNHVTRRQKLRAGDTVVIDVAER
jgi:membrane-bound lytic murein transglycosylase D